MTYVLPQATRTTLTLLLGTGIIVTLVGTGAAWLVTAYDFPGRGILDWALLLPLAVPTYVMAYAYMDVLTRSVRSRGQSAPCSAIPRRASSACPTSARMWGCIFVFGFVLYPYVYLTTRAMFLTQAANLVEARARSAPAGSAVFRRVALPLARPAIAVGVSLALMEALNDIGAAQFLGVRTLTASVYTTWIIRTSLPGAAQIAMAMLVIVVSLILLERRARRNQRYAHGAQRAQPMRPARLRGGRALLAVACGSLPIVIGFLGPALYLALEAVEASGSAGVSPPSGAPPSTPSRYRRWPRWSPWLQASPSPTPRGCVRER